VVPATFQCESLPEGAVVMNCGRYAIGVSRGPDRDRKVRLVFPVWYNFPHGMTKTVQDRSN
jgi:hypothetical protein